MISCSKLDTMYPCVMGTAASRPSGMCRLGVLGGQCLFPGLGDRSSASQSLLAPCWVRRAAGAGAGGFPPPRSRALMKPPQVGLGKLIYCESRSFF